MKNSSTLQNTIEVWRIFFFIAIVLVVFVIYILRLFDLQFNQYTTLFQQAEENRTITLNIPAQRGIIYDRNGVVLAQNVPSYNIVITQANMPDDAGKVSEIIRELAKLTGKPVNQGDITDEDPFVPCVSEHGITQIVNYGETSEPYQAVRLACNVSREIALVVEENKSNWPGIGIEIVPLRDYPTGILTAGIVGFLGTIPESQREDYEVLGFLINRDKIGYGGVELTFQTELGGKNGIRKLVRDVAGKQLQDVVPPIEPVPGKNIKLTIDTRLQQAATEVIKDELDSWNKFIGQLSMTSGVVVAMNPKTGEILSMVSYPSYENNRLTRIIPIYYYNQLLSDSTEPLRNHAVYAELPAGSVFKLVTATGGLNEGVITPDQIIKTPGKLVIQEKSFFASASNSSREFVDWVYKTLGIEGFGQLDIEGCIANSSNVCFYKIGGGYEEEISPGLGICRLGSYARALGYGTAPLIELPETANGLIPDPDWKRLNQGQSWTIGDTYIMSVGQGYALATPLQVLISAATIANNGKLMEPTLLHEILDGEGNVIEPFTPKMRWDLTKDSIIDVYSQNSIRGCQETGEKKIIEPWVFDVVKQGMRKAVLEGTLKEIFSGVNIAAAGKTGTAEYCDKYAKAKDLCKPGQWPTHAWTVAFAPYDDPEIAVVAFVYNGREGSTVAGPIVKRVMQAYFELKTVDSGDQGSITP